MKKNLILATLLFSVSCFAGRAWSQTGNAPKPCDQFVAGLKELGAKKPGALEFKISPNPKAAAQFDKKWFYADLGEYVLPVPGKPTTAKKFPEGTISLGHKESKFGAAVGSDTTISIWQQSPEIKKFATKVGIQSDYDFNHFLFSDRALNCDDIDTAADVVLKLKLVEAKLIKPPFELQSAYLWKEAGLFAFVGKRDDSFYLNLMVKKTNQTSDNIVIVTKDKNHFDQILSYVSQVKNKKFFAGGQAVSF
jgi:hypothetical protein